MERYYAEYTASKAQEYNHLILKPEAIYKVIVLDSDGDTLYVWMGKNMKSYITHMAIHNIGSYSLGYGTNLR